MCGICGIVAAPNFEPSEALRDGLSRINLALARRGPDGQGQWHCDGVALGHRRLSVIDLSDAGAQPMLDPTTGSAIVFNGEIYNYRELKAQLEAEGEKFVSGSDTEVLLALFRTRGPAMLDDLRGMYALAIWNPATARLFLARDPFGIKPLYYAASSNRIIFASQVKAILASKMVPHDPDPAGHAGFFRWGSVPEPFTLYRAIRSLPAGHWAEWSAEKGLVQHPFCSLRDEALNARERAVPIHPEEGRQRLSTALRATMAAHFVADVPVGVFLSGGLDSAMMLGLAAEAGHAGLTAVTLGFEEFAGTDHDETIPAAQTAHHFGAQHYVERLGQGDFEAAYDDLLLAMDQPTIDGVNTYFVSRAAHRHGMKVMLSGLGGDELFGGYSDFIRLPLLHRRLRLLASIPAAEALWNVAAQLLGWGQKRPKLGQLLAHAGSLEKLYLLSRSLTDARTVELLLDPLFALEGLEELATVDRLNVTTQGIGDDKTRLSLLNSEWYMRNQLLRDSDWAGMAHSLEIRVPLVDLELWREVLALRFGGCDLTKINMVASLRDALPRALRERPKTGFAIPVNLWQRGDGSTKSLLPWAKVVHQRFATVCAS